ncbi:MAG: hypothetical protein IPJ89_03945 [Candidatus Iainarchaeum archaeon]|uniref:Glycosyltransferase RgtA/B/C/D-like domain-containing protein n=1 Tax=Candidatus Iainarchaeum sp. TaxID=3101447 RepID=A0A7T9DJ45_9ARCH|nr:MAG: hypothetical protein IPJ89_03945 [Candidatus Diapherotrites archaeon]
MPASAPSKAHAFLSMLESPRFIPILLLLIFLLGVLVRSVPLQFAEFSDPDAFFHARMAQQIIDTHALPLWDALSEQGRIYSYPPLLHLLIAATSIFSGLPVEIAYKWLGIIVGALFGVSVFLLARHWSKSNGIALASALFAVLCSISVLRTSGFLRPDGLATTLIPFILLLWLQRRSVMALLVSVVLVLLHPLSAVVLAALLGSLFVASLIRKETASPLIPVALLGMLGVFVVWLQLQGLALSNYASHVALSASEFARFQLLDFFLLFPLAWAFFFFAFTQWKKMPFPLLLWLVLTLAIGMLGTRMMVFALPFYAIVAGYGFMRVLELIHRDEKAVAVFGVLFLLLGVITIYAVMSTPAPNFLPGEKAAAQWLFAYAHPREAVLSMWDVGHALAYYTHLPQVVDGYFEFAHELDARIDAMWAVHSTSSCETFSQRMRQFNATYVYIGQRELESQFVKLGILEQENCPHLRMPYASDHARVMEFIAG